MVGILHRKAAESLNMHQWMIPKLLSQKQIIQNRLRLLQILRPLSDPVMHQVSGRGVDRRKVALRVLGGNRVIKAK